MNFYNEEDKDVGEYWQPYQNAAKLNKEAKELIISENKASEEDLFPLLIKYSAEYKKLLDVFFACPNGQIKQIETEIAQEAELLKIETNKAIVKSREVEIFKEYLSYFNPRQTLPSIALGGALEDKVDGMYRREDAIRRNVQLGIMKEPFKEINIAKGLNAMVSELDICSIDRGIWVERPKNYVKNMSKEKAQCFLEFYEKKFEALGESILKRREKLAQLKADLEGIKESAQTKEGQKQNQEFNEMRYKLCQTAYEELAISIITYIDKCDETPAKRSIRSALERGQEFQIKNGKKNKDLVSPGSLLYLFNDIDNKKINLQITQTKNGNRQA